jgi:Ran GTPase-activating protein (RanGAP) involved in mRNA processing and transport
MEGILYLGLVYITVELLASTLQSLCHTAVERLYIHHAHLTDQHFEVIADFIRRTTSLTTVMFCDLATTITANSMRMLTDAILANPSIHTLCLNISVDGLMNAIADDAVPVLAEFIRRTQHLQILNLNGCRLNSAQFAQICQAFHDNRSILFFGAVAQNIVGDDMEHLAILTQNNSSLQHIDISCNENLGTGDYSIEHLSNIIRNNNTIQSLNLNYIGLTQEDIVTILDIINIWESNIHVDMSQYEAEDVDDEDVDEDININIDE